MIFKIDVATIMIETKTTIVKFVMVEWRFIGLQWNLQFMTTYTTCIYELQNYIKSHGYTTHADK